MNRAGRSLGLPLALLLAVPAFPQGAGSVLEELRARRIVAADSQTYRSEDKALLLKMMKAEAEGAVDYLVGKYRRYKPFILIVKGADGTERLWLTPAGFDRYFFHKSQDAVHAFEDRGVALKEVFHLTDPRGSPFFDAEGRLTAEGESAYDRIRQGLPAKWKFDWDPVPDSALKEEEKVDPPEVQALLAAGHVEIADTEETWLIRVTKCSESQLKDRGLAVVYDPIRKKPRYFLPKGDPFMALVARYRSGDQDIQGVRGTAFFGKGGGGYCD